MNPQTPLSLFIKRGYYCLQFVDPTGRRRQKSLGTKNKTEAIRALTDMQNVIREKQKTRLLSVFFAEFATNSKAMMSKGTLVGYQSAFKKYFRLVGDCLLTEITPRHWDEYKSKRLASGQCKPVTVNIELRTLKAALSTAVRWQYLERNPFSCQKQCTVEEQVPIFFTKEDFQKLISMIKESWLREIVIIAVLTGMRRGEILNLKWSNVDLKRNVIMIQSSPTFKTKTGKRRCIPLNETASYVLRQKSVLPQSEYVFTLNGKQIRDGWVTHKFKFYVYECRFQDDRLHFHSLRHTFASWLVQDGVSLYEVQKLLGHTDMKVTQIYSHLQPEQLHDTVNRIHIQLN
ncbi:MAG: tyrosine-type recombinase/integrase [Ignavibacteriales bacterium]|nr:tyrosine-type recombinase/integrase [Ignavibacteriales bacterium]